MTDLPRTASLEGLLRRAGAALLDGMHVTLPARVERYDATKQCVDAQPWISREVMVEGVATVERLPVVTNCPVLFPRSGSYGITFPIALGSTVILHFTSAGMDRWLSIGGEVAPEDGRKLTLNDAFAVPSGHSFAGASSPSTTAPEDAMVFHGAAIKFGGPGATAAVAMVPDLTDLKVRMAAWPGTGTSDAGASLKAIFAAWVTAGAGTVKAL